MKDFYNLLEEIRETNPNLKADGHVHVKVTVDKLEKLLKFTFEEGVKIGKESQSLWESVFGRKAL